MHWRRGGIKNPRHRDGQGCAPDCSGKFPIEASLISEKLGIGMIVCWPTG